ncbi:MAG: DNA primase [Deltaproteobacteria bacterium]|nr:DNA primase [Deltaproteobacteria bacterium]
MATRIPDAVIEAVRERVDIVQVVGRHVQLKRAGRGHVGLCPFHHEKTASFNVVPDKRFFHCFGCGETGDVFKFLVKFQNRAFPEVVRELAAEVGIDVPTEEQSPEEIAAEKQKGRLYAMVERALHVFLAELTGEHGAEARAYLEGRHLGAKQWAEFELGYGGGQRDLLWTTLGKTDEDKDDLLKAGLCVSNERGQYDRFAGRVIFPIRDERWRVLGFGGRVFGERAKRDGVAKYLNSPESQIYDKSSAFYRAPQAFQKARKGQPIVVVEGYFDAIALEVCGLAAIASCGTALTLRHAQTLLKLGSKVVLCWDGDAAGTRAVRKSGEVLLPLKVDARLAVLPIGDDPDTYVERVGPAGAARLVDEAEPLPAWVINEAARTAEDAGDDVPARLDAIRRLAWLFQAIPEGLERDMYLDKAAHKLELDRTQLARELAVAAAPRPAARTDAPTSRPAPPRRPPPPPAGPPPLRADEKILSRLVIEFPDKAAPLDDHPLAEQLGRTIRPFLAFVRQKVQEAGPFSPDSPVFKELYARIPHPEVTGMLDEVAKGQRVFGDEEAAGKAVVQVLGWWQRKALAERKASLTREADAAQQRGDQDLVQQLRGHLREVTEALKQLDQGRREGSGPGPAAAG